MQNIFFTETAEVIRGRTFWKHRLVYGVCLLFLLFDIGFSMVQYYHTPMDGDMAGGIVPGEDVSTILKHPLGLPACLGEMSYPNPNKFFAHWTFYAYFNSVPYLLQHGVNPIQSIYLSCAIAKILIQLMLLWLLMCYVTGKTNLFRYWNLIVCAMIIPFFQANGYGTIKIIDTATTYCFFYAGPMVLLLLYFLPLWLQKQRGWLWKPFEYIKWLWIPLALVCSLSGPLNPGIALVVSSLIGIKMLWNYNKKGIDKSTLFYLIPIVICSLYSLFVGYFNSINADFPMPLIDRYKQLPLGIWNYLTVKIGTLVLIIMIAVNCFLLRRWRSEKLISVQHEVHWFLLFVVCYLLMLPLGGYRPYRPYILRFDTAIPITLGLFYLYGRTTLLLLQQMSERKWRQLYLGVVLFVVFIYSNMEKLETELYNQEVSAILQVEASPKEVVALEQDNATIASWRPFSDPEESVKISKMLYHWHIWSSPKKFYSNCTIPSDEI